LKEKNFAAKEKLGLAQKLAPPSPPRPLAKKKKKRKTTNTMATSFKYLIFESVAKNIKR
jgi:hypothetical protein